MFVIRPTPAPPSMGMTGGGGGGTGNAGRGSVLLDLKGSVSKTPVGGNAEWLPGPPVGTNVEGGGVVVGP